MTNLVERVAKAMIEDEWGPTAWLLISNYQRNKALRRARLALSVLGEAGALIPQADISNPADPHAGAVPFTGVL